LSERLAAERLAAHVVATRFEDLPPDAVAAAKTFVLDTLGVGAAGLRAPFAPELLAQVERWGRGDEAHVWGHRVTLPAASAALINGFQAHNQEFDCVHEPAVVHALSAPLAAALAWSERAGTAVSGRDLITALALAIDVGAGLGVASKAALRFFRPATASAFGAVAALGKLAGFDADRLIDAWGIVYGLIGGTMQSHVEGKPLLPMQMGFCTRAAVNAVDLAAAGLDGPRDLFEGKFGYLRLFEGAWDLAPVWDALGKHWRITALSHKPFPTGRATHGGIDGMLRLRARHAIDPARITAVVVHAPPLIHQLVGRPYRRDAAINYARLCLAHVGAIALLRGTVTFDDFAPGRLDGVDVDALAPRIRLAPDGNPDPNALNPQRVEITLADGTVHAVDVATVLGSPANPLSRDQHLEKFRRCWRHAGLAVDNGEALIAAIDRLETLPDTAALRDLLVP
jgi:2-methylcitrate dehydratase PrpD